MSVLLRYLVSMLVHMTWMRMGKGGPVPPFKIPRKGPVNLPVIGPWQVMIGMWLMNKMWEKYGHDVKTHLMDKGSSVAKGVGNLLPNPKNTAQNPSGSASASSAPATVSIAKPVVQAAPAPSHDTQVLSSTPQTGQNPPSANSQAQNSQNLPQGSLLSRLRGAKSSG